MNKLLLALLVVGSFSTFSISAFAQIESEEPGAMENSGENSAVPYEDPKTYPNLKVGGFADISFLATDSGNARSNSGFSEGQFTLHLTSELSDRIGFFGELTLAARGAGTFAPTVERMIVRYDHNDMLRVSLGRYHTPINWWNTAFHHGQWLQTTVARPDMTRFGGSFIPVHFVGALAEGTHPMWGLNFNYQAGIGNGRESTISQGGDAGDFNNSRAWLGTIFFRPDRFYPLQVGGSFYRDKISPTTFSKHRETITSAHITWTKENPELIGEWANVFHHDIVTGREYNSQAWYAQAAYRLPFWSQKWKPYVRYEDLDVDLADPVFTTTQFGRKGVLAGVRYDFADLLAIKTEWRRQRTTNERESEVNSLFMQVSYAF